eukprot:CAMPEP_0174302978 /NCGR_PEP_ID=MMETSP0809-20121228/59919_1 /TAXON_ID=73025 ORGANISM="Eutreptiella gymnastica-like, Strain CCMP1594" /NCGR_SAMPLE_ID=MMETSP0809 /ASSEMBLY_ACC=CAM_ASM_000658 /LENGTH=142 /DNA_ID=CAMNT_0015408931 /DNA_START=39 /DNA_END=467 /DNA_ORIENTATION=+
MGFLSHIMEAEYVFSPNVEPETLHTAITTAIRQLSSSGYAPAVPEQGFKRYDLQRVKTFKKAGVEAREDLCVMCTCTSKLMKFVDDMAFCIGVGPERQVVLRAWSNSRVGQGDLGKNKKNVRLVIDQVSKTLPPVDTTVYAS